jgi:hypothetical protein
MGAPTKYRRWYDSLMARARNRELDCYCERHHVVPRSLIKAFGLKRAAAMVFQRVPKSVNAPENLVKLTYREHFLAHWLLKMMTKGAKDSVRRKMLKALSKMMQVGKSQKKDCCRMAI